MSDQDLKRRVEAVLFAADAPVDPGKLSDVLGGASRADIRAVIRELNDDYERESHSFSIAEIAGGWQIYCRPEYMTWVRELHKGRMSTRLSQAALETLAIVAYKQPIVRAEIEIIRGVDSSGVLATLLKRSLVTIAGRAPGMGRALMYGTTKEFLRYFGLNAVTDLPRLEEFAEVLGLKPDELELAVEGAEALAGMSDAHGESDAEPVEALVNGGPTQAADSGQASQNVTPDAPNAAEPAARPGPEPVTPAPGSANGVAPRQTEGDGVIIRSVDVSDPAPGADRHHLLDKDILEALDED